MKRYLLFFLLSFSTILIIYGCGTINAKIVDNETNQDIDVVELTDKLILVDYSLDNMDRGNHDYMTINSDKKIVIDHEVSAYHRGDVIYYNTSGYSNKDTDLHLEDKLIARVVGLPGEKVEIRKGNVYIDGKKLEAFMQCLP